MSLPQSKDQLRQLAVDEVGMRLLRAAEYVRKHGWCQQTLEDAHGRVCMIGAINAVTENEIGHYFAACERVEKTTGRISTWNDEYGRTANEVIFVLTAAAFRTGE